MKTLARTDSREAAPGGLRAFLRAQTAGCALQNFLKYLCHICFGMTPATFEYTAPSTLSDALKTMDRLGDDAKVLAGGQSLIPLMKLRFTSFAHVVDISRVDGLKYIQSGKGALRIGAMTTAAELERSVEIARDFGAIADAASQIADPLIRNMGPIGGNVCHADPGNDLPAVMISLGAAFVLKSMSGTRNVSAADFFVDTFTTAIGKGELLTEIVIPYGGSRSGSAYVKHKRRAGDFSVAGVAVSMSLDDDGRCKVAGIGLTSVGPKAIKAVKAEAMIAGKRVDEEVIDSASEAAMLESDPADDFYGTRAFKRRVLRGVTADAIRLAAARAAGRVQR